MPHPRGSSDASVEPRHLVVSRRVCFARDAAVELVGSPASAISWQRRTPRVLVFEARHLSGLVGESASRRAEALALLLTSLGAVGPLLRPGRTAACGSIAS